MKKLFLFLLATIILVACDPINSPEPVVEYFTIIGKVVNNYGGKVTPEKQTVKSGGSVTFNNISDIGYIVDYIKYDGNILPAIDVYTVRNITKDDSFEVAFKKDSILFPLLRIKWSQDGDFSFKEGRWTEWNIKDSMVFNFNPDGTYSSVMMGGTLKGTWSLNRNVLPMILNCAGMIPFTVETLNEKVFSIYNTGTDGVIYKQTFRNAGYK